MVTAECDAGFCGSCSCDSCECECHLDDEYADAFLGDDEFDDESDECPDCNAHLGYGESHDSECIYA